MATRSLQEIAHIIRPSWYGGKAVFNNFLPVFVGYVTVVKLHYPGFALVVDYDYRFYHCIFYSAQGFLAEKEALRGWSRCSAKQLVRLMLIVCCRVTCPSFSFPPPLFTNFLPPSYHHQIIVVVIIKRITISTINLWASSSLTTCLHFIK